MFCVRQANAGANAQKENGTKEKELMDNNSNQNPTSEQLIIKGVICLILIGVVLYALNETFFGIRNATSLP